MASISHEVEQEDVHQQQQQHTTAAQLPAQLWSKQLNGVSLSRKLSDFLYAIMLSLPFRIMIPPTPGASSNSSSIGASPARPPKSDRRRSSASPESVLQYTMSSPTASPPVPSSSSIATIAAGAESPVPTASPSSTSATRSSRLSNLSMASASPVLPSIKAGSTPVTPNVLSFQEGSSAFPTGNGDVIAPSLQRNTSTSTAELLSSTLDSYHNDLSREPSSASSSRYSSSVPPSPAMSPAPVASFTAGLDHQLSPTLGPLRIESTTGSKATVIRPDKKKLAKGRTSRSASGRGAFQGGISSEDIFSSNTESNDDGVLSDVPSHSSSRRSRTFSVSSRGKNKRSESQGISSDDVFGRTASPSSPKMPSLANMLTGLRRQSSRPDSRTSSRGVGGGGGDHSSRASSSRHSQSNASMSASASERESVMSDKSRNSSNGKRRNRFSDVLKRKTDADRAEEEEHLRVLAELRLKALALASAPDTQYVSSSTSSSSPALGSRSNERTNAELLVRDMEKHRLSRAESTSSTYSSISAAAAAARNDDTITSPLLHVRSRASSHSSFEHDRNGEDGGSSSAAAGLLLASDRPSADVPFDADESDEDARDARKSFAATGRRATLMPTGSYSSISDSEDHTMPSHPFTQVQHAYAEASDDRRLSQGTVGATAGERRRSTLTPAHSLPSEHMKAHKSHHKRLSREYGPTTGTEADIEDEENPLTSSVLDRRRSTIKVGQDPDGQTVVKKTRSKSSLKRPSSRDSNDQAGTSSFIHRPERTSAIIVPQQQYPTRPRNQSLSSSQSIRNINAEAVLPPVRSSSRTDSPPIRGLPLEQRSISLQSLSQRLADPHVLSPSTEPTLFNVPSALSMSSRHAREGASVSARVSEPGSPTSPSRKLPVDSNDRLTEDIMAAMQQPAATTASSRRSSAEQAKRGSAPRPDLGYHRRSSSDMLALMAQQRQRPAVGHHRRSSSSIDANQKALPARPASSSQQQKRLSASIAKIQSQQYAKLVALLTRNKPLPAAAQIKEEIRSCRSAGERAVLYARKINELAMVESGLEQWLSRTQPSAPDVNDVQWARRRSSAATVQSVPHFNPHHHHALREDNYSEAAFPLRRGSHDVYKARDITQRTPSVAPSTMVPNNIPYPGVYEDSQTLRTSSAMSSHPPSSFRSQSQSFASAALTAAGLPKVGFFGGLGRKSSKRATSSRHKASDGAAGLSISGPIRAPSPESFASSGTRSVSLRPSGPRPSISASSSDREIPTMQHFGTLPTSASQRSLASIPQGSVAIGQTVPIASSRPAGSPLAYIPPPNNEEALTAMADVLPQASKDVLSKYLAACSGDHLAAISAYFDDQRRVT